MIMIKWTDTDPETGQRRFVCAERFARVWSFKYKFQRRGPWTKGLEPTRATWEIVLDALKRRYRNLIRQEAHAPVTFVHLSGTKELIAARMATRTGHFMPASLLDSQFAALEPPGDDEDAISVDIDMPLERIIEAIVEML